MKTIVISIIWLLMPMSLQACGMGEITPEGYENASVEHAWQHWQQGEQSQIPFQFIDVRTPEEFAAGHVPGAVNIPLQTLKQRIAEVPKDKQVYVYCEAGVRSAKAARLLTKAGYTNIENISGGMRAWREQHYPQER